MLACLGGSSGVRTTLVSGLCIRALSVVVVAAAIGLAGAHAADSGRVSRAATCSESGPPGVRFPLEVRLRYDSTGEQIGIARGITGKEEDAEHFRIDLKRESVCVNPDGSYHVLYFKSGDGEWTYKGENTISVPSCDRHDAGDGTATGALWLKIVPGKNPTWEAVARLRAATGHVHVVIHCTDEHGVVHTTTETRDPNQPWTLGEVSRYKSGNTQGTRTDYSDVVSGCFRSHDWKHEDVTSSTYYKLTSTETWEINPLADTHGMRYRGCQ
jgi:hypothetical protein